MNMKDLEFGDEFYYNESSLLSFCNDFNMDFFARNKKFHTLEKS